MNPNIKPVVILMVDDDIEDIYSTKRAFKEGKFANDFRHVKDGDELFAYLENKGEFADESFNPLPHIILLDINLPKKSGIEILKELREEDQYRSIPVVMLTNSENESDILDCYDRGANSFITKPVSIEGMLQVVKHFESYWFQMVSIPEPRVA
jgi:two-component system response regulator